MATKHTSTYERKPTTSRHHAGRIRRAAGSVRAFQPGAVRRHAAGRFYNVPTKSEFVRILRGRSFLRPHRQVRQARAGAQPGRLHQPDRRADLPDARARDGPSLAARIRQATRRGYHNKEWAAKMKAIGLQPSNTGMVGGKETGQQMMDYIIPDGRVRQGLRQTGRDRLEAESAKRASAGGKRRPNSKIKFTCPSCGQNAWGKPDLAITCTPFAWNSGQCRASWMPMPPPKPSRWSNAINGDRPTPSQ